MHQWRRGNSVLQLLEQKQKTLTGHIAMAEHRRSQLDAQLSSKQQACAAVNAQIKQLIPSGIESRHGIYKKVRQQGLLLTRLQLIADEIARLENEQHALLQQMQQLQASRIALDKKHYKVALWLKKVRRDYLCHREMEAENETQEIINNDREHS